MESNKNGLPVSPLTLPPSATDPVTVQRLPVDEWGLLTSLQSDVERARSEYELKHYDAVREITDGIRQAARRVTERGTISSEMRASFGLLLASVECLLARSYYRTGRAREAEPIFRESVRLFQQHQAAIASQRNASRLSADFGIALYRAGNLPEAQRVLEECQKTGAAPPEAFGYLGFVYKDLGRYGDAEAALRRGLQLAPGEALLYSALGDTLELMGRPAEAASAYVDSARAALQRNDTEEAEKCVDSALQSFDKVLPAVREEAASSKSRSLFESVFASLRRWRRVPSEARPESAVQVLFPVVAAAVDVYRLKRDFGRALQVVQEEKNTFGDLPWLVGLEGMLLREMGDPDQAIAVLKAVQVDRPELAWIGVELASALLQKGQASDAQIAIQNALAFTPRNPDALRLSGAVLLRLNDPAGAEKVLVEALAADPRSAASAFELSRARYALGQYPQALEAIDLALQAAPDWIDAMVARVDILSQAGRQDDAIIQARRVLRRDPGNARMLVLLVSSLRQRGQPDDALREIETQLERHSDSAVAWALKGDLLFEKNDLEGAVRALEQAWHLDHNNTDALTESANALRALDRYEQAVAACEQALKAESLSDYSLASIGLCLSEIGEFGRSGNILQSAVKQYPKSASLWYLLGWTLYYRDRSPESIDASISAYREATKLDGRSPWYRKDLADALALSKRDKDAEESSGIWRALVTDPVFRGANDALTLQLLGWCQFRLGNYDEAAHLLLTAANGLDTFVSAQFDYALILLASGRAEAAAQEYRRAVNRARKSSNLRTRGLLFVALADLADSAAEGRIRPEGQPLYKELLNSFRESGGNLSQPVWLPHQLPPTQVPELGASA